MAHEALSEPLHAQKAVLDVIVYRMAKEGASCRFVALQRKQFSGFTASKIERKWLTEYQKYATLPEVCNGCSHFVREDVRVVWVKKMEYKGKFGKHRFYYENKEK